MVDENQDKQRRLPACERCRSRKTKCDSQLPSCSNCLKAGVECMNKDKVLGKVVTRSCVFSLEERLRAYEERQMALEQQSDAGPKRKRSRVSDSQDHGSTKGQSLLTGSSRSSSPSPSVSSSDVSESPMNEEEEEEGSMPGKIDTFLASAFSGDAATHVSDDLDNQIRQYSSPSSRQSAREIFIEKENIVIAKLGRDFVKQGRRNSFKNKLTDIKAYDYNILVRVAKRYFTWMNSAYPVLHECVFLIQLEKSRNRPKEATVIDQFQVNMVIAISLASIGRPHLSTSEIGRIANDFWKSATKLRNRVLFGDGLKKIQNILLLLQYTLLVPKAGNLWQLSGTAMRFATEMGLYTETNSSHNFNPLMMDLRRRIFWTCYCIDRILATVMGRPIGIPESWITTKYPALVEDKLITVWGIESGPICHLKVAQIHQIRIYKLQSEIHKGLYAHANLNKLSDKDMTIWCWQMYDQLRLWRNSFFYPTPLVTKEWTELQFHIAVVLLFRPSPNRSKLSHEALHVAFHSAGEVMKLVKIMHRESSAVFLWLTVQNLFMCGLTFVNSLKELTERRNSCQLCVSFVEVFLLIQSCTAMLETLSALEAGANERIRNAFEMVSSNVLQNINSIAPSLRQQDDYEGCIWSKIAKIDDLSLSRPIQIEDVAVPIQRYSTILREEDMQECKKSSSEFDETHFSGHDVDAYSGNGMLDLPLDADAYADFRGNNAHFNSGFSSHIERSNEQTLQYQSSNDVSSNNGAVLVPNGREDPSLERLTAFSSIVSDAEPIRNINLFSDLSEANVGAELERWFLHPLPESTEQFSM